MPSLLVMHMISKLVLAHLLVTQLLVTTCWMFTFNATCPRSLCWQICRRICPPFQLRSRRPIHFIYNRIWNGLLLRLPLYIPLGNSIVYGPYSMVTYWLGGTLGGEPFWCRMPHVNVFGGKRKKEKGKKKKMEAKNQMGHWHRLVFGKVRSGRYFFPLWIVLRILPISLTNHFTWPSKGNLSSGSCPCTSWLFWTSLAACPSATVRARMVVCSAFKQQLVQSWPVKTKGAIFRVDEHPLIPTGPPFIERVVTSR